MVNSELAAYVGYQLSWYPGSTFFQRYGDMFLARSTVAAHEILLAVIVPLVPPHTAQPLMETLMNAGKEGDAAAEAMLRILLRRSMNEPGTRPVILADSLGEDEAFAIEAIAAQLVQMTLMAIDRGVVDDVRATLLHLSDAEENDAAAMSEMYLGRALDALAAR